MRLGGRLAVAFLFAPLTAPVVFGLVLAIGDFIFYPNSAFSGFGGVMLVLLFGAPIAYLNAAIVATPVLCIIGPKNLTGPRLLLILASISGAVTMIVLGRQHTNVGFVGLGALSGFISSWVFWYIGLRSARAT